MLLTSLSWAIWLLVYVIFRFCLGGMCLLGLETAWQQGHRQGVVRVHTTAQESQGLQVCYKPKNRKDVSLLPPSSYMLDLLSASDPCPPVAPWMAHGHQRTKGLFFLSLLIAINGHNLVPKILMLLVPLVSEVASSSLTRNPVNFASGFYAKSLPFYGPLLFQPSAHL